MNTPVTSKQQKWDFRFLRLAQEVGSWSKDPSTKVGAVLVRPNMTICSVGFNGLPQSIPDDVEILNNVELRHACTIHAEMNALLFAEEKIEGYTLYTYPVLPCDRCAVHFIQKRIARVVTLVTKATVNIPQAAYQRSANLFEEARINVDQYPGILRP